MIKGVARYILLFVVIVLVQVLVLNNIQLSGFINPYLYVLFLLLLPFETPNWFQLFLGFFLGLTIDIFSGTIGIHTSATVFLAYLRPHILNLMAPREGYETGTLPRIYYYGFRWFLQYTVILVLAHHIFLFFMEAFRFSDFFTTLLRALVSAFFSILLILISQFIFNRK
jgi:rod shape-determining protein MreD